MLAITNTFQIGGVTARPITIEVDVRAGLPSLAFLGLPDIAGRERRERLFAAFANSDLMFPAQRVTVNVAPARARGLAAPGWDLAIAVAILAAGGHVPLDTLELYAFWGELGLDGSLRPTPGTVAVAQRAVQEGCAQFVTAADAASRAVLAGGAMDYDAARDLGDVVALLQGRRGVRAPAVPATNASAHVELGETGATVREVRALTIAAAGGHSLLLSGPARSGVARLARALPGLLPELTGRDALEVARIHDIGGAPGADGALLARPYRAPHSSVTTVGLIGGGRHGHIGELTLGHHGVVVLADVDAIARDAVLEAEAAVATGQVVVERDARVQYLPARPLLVATTTLEVRSAHGSLRVGLHGRGLYDVVLTPSVLDGEAASTLTTRAAAALVQGARDRQRARRGDVVLNGLVSGTGARMLVNDSAAQGALTDAVAAGHVHRRDEERVARVARTIADLDNHPEVTRQDVLEALTFAMPCIATTRV